MKKENVDKAIMDFYKQNFDYITFYYLNAFNKKEGETFLRQNIVKILTNSNILELQVEYSGLVYFIDIEKISMILLGNGEDKSYVLLIDNQEEVDSLVRSDFLFDTWSESKPVALITCLEKQNNKKYVYLREIKKNDNDKNILKKPIVISYLFENRVLIDNEVNEMGFINYGMILHVNFNKVNNVFRYSLLFNRLQKIIPAMNDDIDESLNNHSFRLWIPRKKILSPQFIIGNDGVISCQVVDQINIRFFIKYSKENQNFFMEVSKLKQEDQEEIYLIINPTEDFVKKPSYKTLYGVKPFMVFYE